MTTLSPRPRAARHRALPAAAALAAIAVVTLGACAPATSTPLQATTSSSTGPVQEDLQTLVDKAVLDGIPGVVVRIDDGGEPYTLTAQADWAEVLSPDATFRVASNSKTATAVLVLQLVDAGRISLDDTVDTWFDTIPDADTTTVRMLLNHTSGLADYALEPSILAAIAGQRPDLPDAAELVQAGADATLAGEPLQGYHYSNAGYVLLGQIVEHVSGKPLSVLFDENVATPLGLTETRYASPGDEAEVRGYEPDARGLAPILPAGTPEGFSFAGPSASDGWVDVTAIDQSWNGPAGAMISTAAEWATFQRALLGGALLSARSMEDMRTTVPEGESASGPGRSYGLGLERVETACGTVWGHDGALPGYGSDTYTDEVGGRSMTVFTTSNFGILTQPGAVDARTGLIEAAACAMFGDELPA